MSNCKTTHPWSWTAWELTGSFNVSKRSLFVHRRQHIWNKLLGREPIEMEVPQEIRLAPKPILRYAKDRTQEASGTTWVTHSFTCPTQDLHLQSWSNVPNRPVQRVIDWKPCQTSKKMSLKKLMSLFTVTSLSQTVSALTNLSPTWMKWLLTKLPWWKNMM